MKKLLWASMLFFFLAFAFALALDFPSSTSGQITSGGNLLTPPVLIGNSTTLTVPLTLQNGGSNGSGVGACTGFPLFNVENTSGILLACIGGNGDIKGNSIADLGGVFTHIPVLTTPFLLYAGSYGATGQFVIPTANGIYLSVFTLPYSQQVNYLIIDVLTGGGASQNCDLGIYNTSGTLMLHVGGQQFNLGLQKFAVVSAPITLAAGQYVYAVTSANTNLGIPIGPNKSSNTSLGYTTATKATSGTLPSSITLSSLALQTSQPGSALPVFALTTN